MSTVEHQNFTSLPVKTRLRIFFTHHILFTLSLTSLICKIIVLTGLLITIFFNHWAKHSIESGINTGGCLSINFDPIWLVNLICVLAIVNLCMELINISIIWYFHYALPKIFMLLGFMFILTFIITDCGVVFVIHIASCIYKPPIGYTYYGFIFSIIFTIVDWGLSLKRFISDLPEIIYSTEDEYGSRIIVYSHRVLAVQEEVERTPLNSLSYDDSTV